MYIESHRGKIFESQREYLSERLGTYPWHETQLKVFARHSRKTISAKSRQDHDLLNLATLRPPLSPPPTPPPSPLFIAKSQSNTKSTSSGLCFRIHYFKITTTTITASVIAHARLSLSHSTSVTSITIVIITTPITTIAHTSITSTVTLHIHITPTTTATTTAKEPHGDSRVEGERARDVDCTRVTSIRCVIA
ncbi:hypothetical protein E2C01_090362 [Portunus trituberculatus]|uniref:Uncharacterized protein n=1 Tax=Portunus trituberculatus TaxID=210409 RepID=A0A5B7JKP5_PORTR|nr:hypothetical protein [Portunus trituberculatus]